MDFLQPEETGGPERNHRVSALVQAYLNENAAPELLPYRGELVDEIREQVEAQEAQLEEVVEGPDPSVEEVFTASLYQMDLDRVKYGLAKYLRVRLLKLERCSALFRPDLAPELADAAKALRECLSDEELQFARALEQLYADHLGEAILKHLPADPEQLHSLGGVEMCRPPRADRFVFCRVREDIAGFLAHPTAEPVTWEAGDVHVAHYAAIKTFVEDGRMDMSAPHFEDPMR